MGISLLFVKPAGLEAGVRELVDQHLQRHAVLQHDRYAGGEAVHQAADDRAFLGHGDEHLAGLAVRILADGDVALVAGDAELVRDRPALVRQTHPLGLGRSQGLGILAVGVLLPLLARIERLQALAAVAVDGDGLQAHLPGLECRSA
jgi:hypothetical protein